MKALSNSLLTREPTFHSRSLILIYPICLAFTVASLNINASSSPLSYSTKISTSVSGSELGIEVVLVNDMNKDGYDDIIIGAPNDGSTGQFM